MDFTPLSETYSKGLFFKKLFLSVGLLSGFTLLILIDGVIILGQLLKILMGLTKCFLLWCLIGIKH